MNRLYVLTAVIAVVFLLTTGCTSSQNDPLTPQPPDLTPEPISNTGNVQLMGLWEIYIDEDSLEARVEPVRALQAHQDITSYAQPPACTDCLAIHALGFDPVTRIVEVDVTLTNHYPSTGYDVRGIIYTCDDGHLLLNDNAWTGYFDIPGGQLINPFIAFDEWWWDRSFQPGDSQTEFFRIYMPPVPDDPIQFALTASLPVNCDDPYAIENFHQDGVLSPVAGSLVTCTVDVLDWQDDVDNVVLHAPAITGEPYLPFMHVTGSEWAIELENTEGASVGEYGVRIAATSINSGPIETHKYAVVRITNHVTGSGWARSWGATMYDTGWGVASDNTGNVYVGGGFRETVDMDPGPDFDYRTSTSAVDSYVSKFDSNGIHLWTTILGQTGTDLVSSIICDEEGNLFVANMHQNAQLRKIDSDGNLIWAIEWGEGAGTRDIALSTNYIFVSGLFKGTVDFDPGPGINEINSVSQSSYYDKYISCFDREGNYQWTYTWYPGKANWEFGICSDLNDSVYASGEFVGEVDFDPGPGQDIHIADGEYSDVYLLKIAPDGVYQWTKSWGGDNYTNSRSVATDGSNAVYVPGSFSGECDFDPSDGIDFKNAGNSRQLFLSIFDSTGNYLYSLTWDGLYWGYIISIKFIDGESMHLAGSFEGSCDFDPGDGIDYKESLGHPDIFVLRMDTPGNYAWGTHWGMLPYDMIWEMANDADGNSYLTGWFEDEVDFDPGESVDSHISNGYEDTFIIKVRPDGTW